MSFYLNYHSRKMHFKKVSCPWGGPWGHWLSLSPSGSFGIRSSVWLVEFHRLNILCRIQGLHQCPFLLCSFLSSLSLCHHSCAWPWHCDCCVGLVLWALFSLVLCVPCSTSLSNRLNCICKGQEKSLNGWQNYCVFFPKKPRKIIRKRMEPRSFKITAPSDVLFFGFFF